MECGLVKQVKTWQDGWAIEQLSDSGVFRVCSAGVGGVDERVVTDHVATHVVRPLENLRADINQEHIR